MVYQFGDDRAGWHRAVGKRAWLVGLSLHSYGLECFNRAFSRSPDNFQCSCVVLPRPDEQRNTKDTVPCWRRQKRRKRKSSATREHLDTAWLCRKVLAYSFSSCTVTPSRPAS